MLRTDPASPAKTTRPDPVAVVARERLFARLDELRRAPLVWISGPPGCGKTSLLSSYVASRHAHCHWYQLDAGDSDVATFFYYAQSGWAKRRRGLPAFTRECHADPAAFARRFCRQLYTTCDTPFLLVLDGYQELRDADGLLSFIGEAVAEMPPEGCLVVISRGEPPARLARLRANRLLQTLDGAALRLTREESDCIALLSRHDLDEGTLAHLHEITAGWAAGLVLMLEQPGRWQAPPRAAHEPPGSDFPLVFDYLAGEVFDGLDATDRSLLLRTAFLSDITVAAARELAARADAGERLAALQAGNRLVFSRAAGGDVVYGYHPLLRRFLVTRAERDLGAAECDRLRHLSATLAEQLGDAAQAVTLLVACKDWHAIEALVLRHAPRMLRVGRADALLAWIAELPEAVTARNPWLLYWQASARFLDATHESRLLFERAHAAFEDQPDSDPRGRLLACSGVLDAIVYELDDLARLDTWIARMEALLSEAGEHLSGGTEARVTASLFIALVLRQPQHPDIEQWMSRAHAAVQTSDDDALRMSVELMVATTLVYTGRFVRARDLIESMRRRCDSAAVTPLALTTLKVIEATYSMLRGDHAACLKAVYDGVDACRESGIHLWHYHLLGDGVAGALSAGDTDTAARFLARMHDFPAPSRRLDLSLYHHYNAWHAVLCGDLARATEEQRSALALACEAGCPFYEILCRMAFADLLAEGGDESGAGVHLRRVHRDARGIRNRLLEFMCLLVYAHIALEHGRRRSGLNALRYALAIGREHGFRNFPWWRPTVMTRLCTTALESGIEVEYVRTLIRDRGLEPCLSGRLCEAWPWRFRAQVLGRFRLELDGAEAPGVLRGRGKPAELLKALLALGARDVPEDRLAEAVWPRVDADYALRSLATTLHRLRKLLGEDTAIVLQHGRLWLEPKLWWTDHWALDAVLDESDGSLRAAGGTLPAERAAERAARLLDLYGGPLLAGEPERACYLAPRERLRSRLLRLLGQLLHRLEEAGEIDLAIECWQRYLDADDATESVYRRLMLCYRDAGMIAEAMETYDRCRRTLDAIHGERPAPETTALYASLRQRITPDAPARKL